MCLYTIPRPIDDNIPLPIPAHHNHVPILIVIEVEIDNPPGFVQLSVLIIGVALLSLAPVLICDRGVNEGALCVVLIAEAKYLLSPGVIGDAFKVSISIPAADFPQLGIFKLSGVEGQICNLEAVNGGEGSRVLIITPLELGG